MSEDDTEERERMVSNAMGLLLAASRTNHILHDAALEVDKEIDRLRAENERLRATLVAISDGTVLAMPFAAALAKQCLKWVDTELTS